MGKAPYPVLSAAEAAAFINHNHLVGLSGFTAAGTPKAVPAALAKRAQAEHAAGRPFRIRLITGASTGPDVDDALAAADAISWRAPYQGSKPLRDRINAGQCEFVEMHLSHVPQAIEFGFIGPIDVAVVEATEVTADGRVYLTTGSGISPSLLRHAEKVIIEINAYSSPRLAEMHDVALLPPPPARSPIPITEPLERIGTPFAFVDPKRIVGIVHNEAADGVPPFTAPDAVSQAIAGHVVAFLHNEMLAGRIPKEFLPLQAGVGNVSNAVMAALGLDSRIPPFAMYTEVLQDAQVALLESGRMTGASTCALAVSNGVMDRVFSKMDFFARRIVLRPQEISNNPGVVRRLGVIAINTVLEMDLYGHTNSTHVAGTQLVNAIGGSGDFTRNAYISIQMCPSIAKGGKISSVVPMVSHVDHNEHSVQVLVTEQGLADLRGLGPLARAHRIIDNCAHPSIRPLLREYLGRCRQGHIPHDLATCLAWHQRLATTGSMFA